MKKLSKIGLDLTADLSRRNEMKTDVEDVRCTRLESCVTLFPSSWPIHTLHTLYQFSPATLFTNSL